MANKISYIKRIDEYEELVLIEGYVGENQAYLFIRNMDTNAELINYGVLDIVEAMEIYNNFEEWYDEKQIN